MLMWGLNVGPLHIGFFVVALAIAGAAQSFVRSTFATWDAVAVSVGLAGAQVGQRLVSRASFGGVLTLLDYRSLARR